MLGQYVALESLRLPISSFTSECLAGLSHFQRITRLETCVEETDILRSVFALTHLRELRLHCWTGWTDQLQNTKLPCNHFAHLTLLDIETLEDEPEDAFNYLSQLHDLLRRGFKMSPILNPPRSKALEIIH